MELDNNIQNATSEGATPNELETQQEVNEESASDTAPQDPTAPAGTSARSDSEGADSVAEQPNADTPFLSFRFNHEEKVLSRDEAVNAAQIGLKYGAISEKLDRAAAIKGVSAAELIDSMISAERDKYRSDLVEKLGEDGETVERLMKLYDIEQADKYQKVINDKKAESEKQEQTLNERLANEFISLKAEFPEYAEYGNLPVDVRREAENGRDLMSALLLHQHRINKAAASQKEQEAVAAKATAGSLSGENDNESADINGFIAGVWR